MLLAMMAWTLCDSCPRILQTDPDILGWMWICVHSKTLQHFMEKTSSSISDQLRIQGINIEVSLLNLNTGSMKYNGDKDNNIKESSTIYFPNWHQFVPKGQFVLFNIHKITKTYLFYRAMLSTYVVPCSSWPSLCTTCDPYLALNTSSRAQSHHVSL